MADKEMTAAELIAAVMQEVQGVAKSDTNQAQGFKFRGIDAVVNAVGPALRKHGGFIVPRIWSANYEQAESARGGRINICKLEVEYQFHSSSGDYIGAVVAAEAFDSGDKATAKAMSVAFRTAMLQVFCLPTDEPDPDSFSYEVVTSVMESVDWGKELAKVSTADEARELWKRAAKQNASKDTLTAIEKRGAELDD